MRSTARSQAAGQPGNASRPEAELAARLADIHSLYRGLAHDLRGPLNAIVLQLELLRSEVAQGDPGESSRRRIERLERELDQLRSSTERLLSLIASPGSFFSDWDAGELATAVAELVAPQAHQRRVAVEAPSPSRPLPTSGDRGDALAACLRMAVDGLAALPEGARLAIRVSGGEAGEGTIFRVELDAEVEGAASDDATELAVGGLQRAAPALEALGGRLSVERTAPRRVALTAWLPRALAHDLR